VAVATYNGASYLREQLSSIASQTMPPSEVVICDDASSDETIVIAYEFATRSIFDVKVVVNSSNLGYAQNFSKALQSCSGDIVFLCDQDDVWLPTKIEKMMDRFNSDPEVQLLIHDLEFCNERLEPIGQTKIGRMQSVSDINRDFIVGMATAIRGP